MPNILEKKWNNEIRRYRRRLFCRIFLMAQIRYGSGALLVSGVFFLIFRLFAAKNNSLFLPAALLPAGLSSAAALCFAVRKCPAVSALRTAFAALTPEGGRVLSFFETRDEKFAPLPELPPFPRVSYLTCRRDLLLLLAAAFFGTATLFVPVKSDFSPVSPAVLDVKDEKENLSRSLETLKELSPKGTEKALALQKELEEAVRRADPASPGRTYELLQELNRRTRQELAQESSQSTQLMDQLNALRQLAENVSKDKSSSEKFTQLLKELAGKNPALADSLKKGNFNGRSLSPEEIKKLASSLKTEADRLKKALEDMSCYSETAHSGKKSDPAASRQELKEFLKNNVPGSDDMIEALTNRSDACPGNGTGSGTSDGPGQGGPARGGGSAPLEFSNIPVEMDTKMVDRKAVPAKPGFLKDSTVLGRFASGFSPKPANAATPRAGTLQNGPARTAFQESAIHPAHRRAVRRYFERKEP